MDRQQIQANTLPDGMLRQESILLLSASADGCKDRGSMPGARVGDRLKRAPSRERSKTSGNLDRAMRGRAKHQIAIWGQAAFDYVVVEKLLNFADAAARHPAFARELPRFVSEVRRMFTPQEIEAHLARVERDQIEKSSDIDPDDDFIPGARLRPPRDNSSLLPSRNY